MTTVEALFNEMGTKNLFTRDITIKAEEAIFKAISQRKEALVLLNDTIEDIVPAGHQESLH